MQFYYMESERQGTEHNFSLKNNKGVQSAIVYIKPTSRWITLTFCEKAYLPQDLINFLKKTLKKNFFYVWKDYRIIVKIQIIQNYSGILQLLLSPPPFLLSSRVKFGSIQCDVLFIHSLATMALSMSRIQRKNMF